MKIGILFDLDGTLLDTLDDLANAVNYTLRHFGCPEHTREEVRQFVGTGMVNLVRLSLPGKESDPPLEEALAVYREYYAAHSQDKTRPYDGIPEALQEIGSRYPVAVVSNKPDGAVKILCKDYFGDLYARGESSDCPRKPAPDMVHRTMAEIGVDACVYVGDSEVDVTTARNAGVPCLSVLWGFRDKDRIEAEGGKHFCADPRELPAKLAQLIKEYYGQ